MSQPLVSAIITTKNSGRTLAICLQSLKEQDYPNLEIVVVDNASTDDTKEVAKGFTDLVFDKGPERSAQRNYAVEKAKGEYVAILDSDMKLSPQVISQCVAAIQQKGVVEVVIPEESFGEGFWAQCKKLERSFYIGVSWIEAARFFPRELFQKVGGYDTRLNGGEDWELSQRIGREGDLAHIEAFIYHDEGKLSLRRTMAKKYYYAKDLKTYMKKETSSGGGETVANQTSVLARYKLFFAQPGKLFANPVLGLGMLWMKTAELGAAGFGYLVGR